MKKTVFGVIALGVAASAWAQLSDDMMHRAPLADGGHVDYAVRGEGEPVLLLHGAVLADAMLPIFESAELDGFQLIRVHRRGYVESSPLPDSFGMSDQARDAIAVLDTLGLDSAHVAGHSYGTAIAMQMAIEAPERVRSVTLIDMVPPPGLPLPNDSIPPQGESAGALMLDVRNRLAAGSIAGEDAVATVFDMALGSDWREFFDAVDGYEQAVADIATTFPVENRAMGQWQAQPVNFAEIRTPILVVWGEDQWQHPPSLGEAFREALPQTELRPIANADHASIIQKPVEIAQAIAEFVSGH